jgi:hypothetical protein
LAKPTKVRYSGVGVSANGYLLSRVQNVSVDTDLGEEEARELTNSEVVEFTTNNPNVSISIETNEYGSCRNLRAFVATSGGALAAQEEVNVDSFDGTSADIAVQIEEDNVIKRTVVVNDAFPTAVSWNFDVGGVATESFTLEADNKTWYANAWRQAHALNGSDPVYAATGSSVNIPLSAADDGVYTPVKQYVDGILITGALGETDAFSLHNKNWKKIHWYDDRFDAVGTRYRTVIVKDSPDTTIDESTSSSAIGSITRGKINIYLASGADAAGVDALTSTNFLRLQSASVDVDLSREVLQQLGNFRAFDRSLTLPVNVNLTFSALASDLEEWAKLSDKRYSDTANTTYDITDFTKTAEFKVDVFDAQDNTTGTRSLLKSLLVTGLQVVSESFGVDVGGNATQDFTCRASNFLISGSGVLEDFPLSDAVTD